MNKQKEIEECEKKEQRIGGVQIYACASLNVYYGAYIFLSFTHTLPMCVLVCAKRTFDAVPF